VTGAIIKKGEAINGKVSGGFTKGFYFMTNFKKQLKRVRLFFSTLIIISKKKSVQ
jgi:hypothetical protein